VVNQPAVSMSRSQLVLMVTALVFSVVAVGLGSTMVAPAVHDINTHLGPGAFVTMSTYFYLAGAIANVVLVRWSDYVGRKRILLAILVVACVGTALCVVSTSLPVVVFGRFLQGTGNVTFAMAFLILRTRVSGPTFGVCCGIVSSINGGVAGGDAFVGGLMVDRWGYRSIFVLILVIGLFAIVFAVKSVPADDPAERQPGRMDWVGAALISMTVGGINLFFSAGSGGHWLSQPAVIWFVAFALAFVALIAFESRTAHPLVDIKHMRTREAWPLILVTILVMGSFMIVLGYVVPALAEDPDSGFGLSATATALMFLTPAAVIQLMVAPLMGRLAVRIGFVTMLRIGVAGTVAVTVLLAIVAQHQHLVAIGMALYGFIFTGTLMTAMGSLGVLQASDEAPGALPGISNASYGIGSSIGFAWVGPIVGSGTVSSFANALWICVGIGVVALICALILKPKQVSAPGGALAGAR